MPASWTQLEWDERMALKGKPLAQGLHSYFSTHAAPFPVSLKSGSPTKLLKHFKTELRRAFDAMHEKIGWEFTWDGDVESVTRTPTDAQGRHLARRRAVRRQAALKPGMPPAVPGEEKCSQQQIYCPACFPACPHPGRARSEHFTRPRGLIKSQESEHLTRPGTSI